MMQNAKRLLLITVFTMFAPLLKAFGMDSPPENVMGATRYVNFSGNIFSFSMPEDFSKDMPAAPLIERFDISSPIDLKNSTLMQRWWDIKKPGFFGKELGTVMMSLNAYSVPQNTRKKIHDAPYNPQDRVDLILIIDELIHTRYADKTDPNKEFSYSLPSIAAIAGSNIETEYRDKVYGKQKWTSYSIAGWHDQLIVNSVLPLSDKAVLEVSFTFSPNNGVLPRTFLEYAYKVTDPIHESFTVEYREENPIKLVVGKKWLQSSADDALREKQNDIVLPLFGREIHQKLLLKNN